ncbi:MAG: leucine-rich repeat domain-containing protein, partial [Clostridia bacterium]|nr:leucine-rich repeat domain-containing protein [Clostridia bacterium]
LGGDLDLTEIETLGKGAFELDGIMSDIGTNYIHENGLEFNNVKLGDKLKTIEIWTFYGRYIKNITLGNGIVEIKRESFWNNNFSEVVIPDSVTTIAKWAFADCPNLHSVTYGANMSNESQLGFTHISTGPVVEICNRSQYVTSARPAGTAVFITSEEDKGEIVTDSNNFRFYINAKLNVRVLLKSLNGTVTTLPDAAPDGGTYEVGYYAFREKFRGTKLEVPEKVTRIRNGAFAISPSLTTVILGNGVTQIDEDAFSTCQNLLSVTLGASVQSIGNNAFNNCDRLIEVANLSTLDIKTKSYDNGRVACYALNVYDPKVAESKLFTTDDGYMFYADLDNATVYLVSYTGGEKHLVLPDNFLGEAYGLYAYAFYGCDGMTGIVIPESITTIDESALCCTGLTVYCKGESAGENWGNDWNGWGCPVVWDCDNNDTDEDGYAYAVIDGIR